jgi:hypothetical protein
VSAPVLPVLFDREPLAIVDPDSGEALALRDASLGALARWRRRVREVEQLLGEAKRIADDEVLRRMDERAEWTLREDGLALSAPSPNAAKGVEWTDVRALREELAFLGVAREAIDRAFEPVTEYRPRARGIDRLRKLNRADVDEVLDRHASEVERPRRVSVKSAGGA